MTALCLLVLILNGLLDIAVPLQTSACFGNPLTSICSPEEIFKLNKLYANAKTIATKCPNHHPYPPECCIYNSEDCNMEYKDYMQMGKYFSHCVGSPTCSMQATWQPTIARCDRTVFQPTSVYMVMDYSCIATQDIVRITSDKTGKGSTLTLAGPGYPSSNLPANSHGICSVSADCDTTINVTALDIDLHNDSKTCQQFITIEDNGSRKKTIDCADNNQKRPKTLYTSQTHFLKLTYKSSLSIAAGRLWMEFTGTNNHATLDIRCGTSILTSSHVVSSCPQSTTSATVVSSSTEATVSTIDTLFAVDTPSNTEMVKSSPFARSTNPTKASILDPTKEPSMSSGQVAGIVVGMLALLILVIAIVVWRIKKKSKGRVSDVNNTHNPSGATVAGVAPTSSSLGIPHRLPPLQTTGSTPGERNNTAWN